MEVDEKKPRLFYYCDDLSWLLAPDDISGVVGDSSCWEEGERFDISFKWVMMTDAEVEELPDV